MGWLSKKKESVADLGQKLSPEADAFIAQAASEFKAKQAILKETWRVGTSKDWAFDQGTGVLNLEFEDGSHLLADGQILGSLSQADSSWEWSWNNPHVSEPLTKASHETKSIGEQLGISYLTTGMVPLPDKAFIPNLCAIGVKASNSVGVFPAHAGQVHFFILLKNLRGSRA